MNTYCPTAEEITRLWYVVDADGKTLGRLASEVADILRGKKKPEFTPHLDCGDFVIVVNAEKIKVTGRKETQKVYVRHSGFPHGFKQETLKDLRERKPEAIVEKAVRGMLPHTRLGDQQFTKLKVYAGPEHPHKAQNPQEFKLSQ